MSTETAPVIAPRRGRLGLLVVLLLVAGGGIYAGMRWHLTFERWLVPHGGAAAPEGGDQAGGTKRELWTCGMHPQVIQDHPGDCPICHMKLTPLATGAESAPAPAGAAADAGVADEGRAVKYWWDPMMNPPYISDKPGTSPMGMDLVPVYEDGAQPAGAVVVIDPAVVQNMGVRTAEVTEGTLAESIRVTALIDEAEPGHLDVNLRVSGWIQTLYANADGMEVREGDPLFDLYSPELTLAIEELISARRAVERAAGGSADSLRATSESLKTAAETRLMSLGLSREQIADLGASDHAPAVVTFRSPMNGHVTEKAGVYTGSSVTAGQFVLRLAQRTTMWVEGRVSEGALGRVRVGQTARARVDAYPGRTFEGAVIFIHPHLDEMTRTAMVRMVLPNHDHALHQGMFATIDIDTGGSERVLLVPREAVLDTGESQLVFVSAGQGRFEPRRVVMGRSGTDGQVQILSGLTAGEHVVTSGQFLLDSESRLREAIAKFLGQAPVVPDTTSSGASLTAPGASAGDEPSNAGADAVVRAYLPLAESLGGTPKDDAPLTVDALITAIHALRGDASPNRAALIDNAATAAEALKGQTLDTQRDRFKALSAAVIGLLDALPPSPAVRSSLFVVHCPMAKADWLQQTRDVANPYYADSMKACGSVVRRVSEKGAR